MHVLAVKRDASRAASRTSTSCTRWTSCAALVGRADGIVITLPADRRHRAGCSTPTRSPRSSPAPCSSTSAAARSIDEEALAERLQDGTLKGAALDVFAEEPLPQDSPLWGLENAIVTPHDIALVPAEEPRIVDLFIDNLRRRRAGEPLRNAARPRGALLTAIAPEDLERWSEALLEASGLEGAHAETVALSLVHANRRGTDSHGGARLPVYSGPCAGAP